MRAGSGRPYAEFLVWLLPDLDRIRQLGISLRRDGHVEADTGRGFLLVFVRRLRDRPVATDRFDDRHGDILALVLSLIHISEPTRLLSISYAVFCLKKK